MMENALTVKKLAAVSDLIRLTKQYGTLLCLWPALWSLFIASKGLPQARLLVIFVLGAFLMRSAGCAVNDIADRGFDSKVQRTMSRPLADGRLKVKEALFVFFCLSILAFVLVLFLNRLTIMLSFVGLFLACLYPFVKRVSRLPQAFLGIAFGWGAVMAWAAVTGTIGAAGVLIFAANIFWSMAYDTIYALMDKEDDIKAGVKSTAILFGAHVYKALYALYFAFAVMLGAAGVVSGLGALYYAGVFLSLVFLLSITGWLEKNPTRQRAFNAFVANAALGALIFVSIVLDAGIRF